MTPEIAIDVHGLTKSFDGRKVVRDLSMQVKRGTIYGAPTANLKPGTHQVVAFARTATHASAVAWTFRV